MDREKLKFENVMVTNRAETGEQLFASWVKFPKAMIQGYESPDANLDRVVELYILNQSSLTEDRGSVETDMISIPQIASRLKMNRPKGRTQVADSIERIAHTTDMKGLYVEDESSLIYRQPNSSGYVIVDRGLIRKLLNIEVNTEPQRWRIVSLTLMLLEMIPYHSNKKHDLVCYPSQVVLGKWLNTSARTVKRDLDILMNANAFCQRKVRKLDGDCYYVYARGGDESQLEKYCTRIVNEGRVKSYAKD